MNSARQDTSKLSTVCTSCGHDAVIYSEDGLSAKCDECGQFSSKDGAVRGFDPTNVRVI